MVFILWTKSSAVIWVTEEKFWYFIIFFIIFYFIVLFSWFGFKDMYLNSTDVFVGVKESGGIMVLKVLFLQKHQPLTDLDQILNTRMHLFANSIYFVTYKYSYFCNSIFFVKLFPK